MKARRLHPKLWVLANPSSNRARAFTSSARGLGWHVEVIPYADYLAGLLGIADRLGEGDVLRIDSPGEDFDVARGLLKAGIERRAAEGAAPLSVAQIDRLEYSPGEMLRPRQWYLGYCELLSRLACELRAGLPVRLMAHPEDIPTLFDKPACQARWQASGLPVPRSWAGLSTYDEIRDRFRDCERRRLFVKLAHGYSAMGAVALEWQGSRMRAITATRLCGQGDRERLYMSNRVRVLHDESEIAALVDALGRECVIVEDWLPKARLDSRAFDLRVLVIAGRACHAVGRTSDSPFCNLNLGGQRASARQVQERLGGFWPRALELCERAAGCFPRSFYVGVDLLVSPNLRSGALLEANAFGDYLPGLRHDGLDVYETQLLALSAPAEPAPCST